MLLRKFQKEDFACLRSFMTPLWHETYGKIIPKEQIDFLLEKYFSEPALVAFQAKGYEYYKIDETGVLVYVERETELYIDKLYLPSSMRGKGYPQRVFSELLKHGKPLRLNVNQANERAVQCYLKNGFQIVQKIDINLGNGMTNCDYVMERNPSEKLTRGQGT